MRILLLLCAYAAESVDSEPPGRASRRHYAHKNDHLFKGLVKESIYIYVYS